MAGGGARNRSGPPKSESSGRSDRLGYTLESLPAEGFKGRIPKFPLMPRSVLRWEFEEKRRYQVVDDVATEAVAEREHELWKWAWRTPQACAWSLPTEKWRINTIAMWVRTFVICESNDATAADKGSLHRFADQIGLTTAGLAEMGWKIIDAPPERPREEPSQGEISAPSRRPRRLRSVGEPGTEAS